MASPADVARLVERFAEQRQDYRSGRYNEAQLRQDFLNPFFEALGWDVLPRLYRPGAIRLGACSGRACLVAAVDLLQAWWTAV